MSKAAVVEEIHRSARKNFPRRHVIVKGLEDLWMADLMDLRLYSRFNSGYNFVLTVINAFSKFVWAVALKTKSAKEVTKAFEKILKEAKTRTKLLQVDQGGEFYNKEFKNLLQKYNIKMYSTYTHIKASMVERVIKSLKQQIWKRFSLNGNYRYIDFLPEIVSKYNATKHSTIKMRPKDVRKKHEKFLLSTVYNYNTRSIKRPKFKIGDTVRVSRYKTIFEKGYLPSWSTELFTIAKIQFTNPVTYILKDYEDNLISGAFYEYEIQKTKFKDTYLVEKILKTKADKVYVKWLGFSNSHNSWIKKADLLNK